MPQHYREAQNSARVGHDSHARSSHQEGSSRRRRDDRSLSPDRSGRRYPEDRKRRASPSGRRERESKRQRSSERHRHHHQHGSSSSRVEKRVAAELPYGARHLSKDDLKGFEPLFAEYLDLQKQKNIEEMDEREVRGRWKSFVGKWNRGELAEGWYDPEMFQRILERGPPPQREPQQQQQQQQQQHRRQQSDSSDEEPPEARYLDRNGSEDENEDEDMDYGPVLPGAAPGDRRAGATIPNKQDLTLRDELAEESREADREDLRTARKADRKLQKERLEELVPRAEAGTRERKLEKRQEVNDKMRQFRDKSPGGEVRDSELMGGGDSLEEYKQAKEKEQRRKSEREIRREEIERAKREEIEEKRRAWQEREDKTVSMLRELARQRFGS
ncbi:uncharacterized protein TrAtP1_008801 [Trichoderma atroviride]|uniref:RNA helicase HEL117 n=1 Tax=Hypocrea atroviridis (strain ATCC 20476 / IMI 206040) TaxID=452589 RepID=G9NXV4_HYPAI|nr:uncharacterized protein TRIATDRAFT_79379 [Trichoderma atroviride IMI 206040]EHK44283.1 hypothetical protein TRIATDRAFT_79379 [Trichoderma atroviride IMI 206040]UKZ67646.1 hypothetical protein TrAtP1_008801 [Trichoderma atroviride]